MNKTKAMIDFEQKLKEYGIDMTIKISIKGKDKIYYNNSIKLNRF